MPKPLPELQQIHTDAGLPLPAEASPEITASMKRERERKVHEQPLFGELATHVPERPTSPHAGHELTPEQREAAEEKADEILEISDRMIDTRKDIDELLGQASKAAYIIDWVIDPIAGFVPVIGDSVGSLAGIYIIQKAREAGVPREQIRNMILNLTFDFVLGWIPVIGDAADFFWFRANRRNVEIFRKYAEDVKTDKYRPKF